MQKNTLLFDPNFNPNKLVNYSCVLQLSNNAISYKIIDPIKQTILVLEQLVLNTQLLIESNKLERYIERCYVNFTHCKNVKAIVQTSNFVTIPNPLFSPLNLEQHITLNCGAQPKQTYLSTENIQLNLQTVFSIPEVLYNFNQKTFNTINHVHYTASLLDSIFVNFNTKLDDQLFIDVNLDKLTICCFTKQGLRYCNQFNITTAEDFIYFLLFVCDQLQLETNKTKLILLGDVLLGDKMHHYAYNYFSKIQFGETTNKNNSVSITNELEKHRFYTLIKETA